MNRAILLPAALGLALSLLLLGQDLPAARPRPILIIGGTLIDGTGTPPRRNDAILISDGYITSMGLSAERKAPGDARLIDAARKWIVPGFIDAAVHLFRTGDITPGQLPGGSPASESAANMRRAPAAYLRPYLCAGVTSVLNIGGPPSMFDLRNGRVDDPQSPRIETTGPTLALLLTAQPGGVASGGDLLAAGPHGAALLVGRLAPSRPALVSVRVEPSVPPGASGTFLSAAVVAAHGRRLRVIAEASTTAELRSALDSGVDAVVSRVSEPIGDAIIQRIVSRRVAIVPTMVVDDAQRKLEAGDTSLSDFETTCAPAASLESLAAWKPMAAGGTARNPTEEARLERELEGQKRNVRRLIDAGAIIVAGSGAGEARVFHGPSLHREFELLAEADLLPIQILLSATRNAAVLIGRQREVGQIREGMAADLVLLAADPLADIRNARKVVQTIRGGALYER